MDAAVVAASAMVLGRLAEEVRAVASQAAAAAGVEWSSTAAGQFRGRLSHEAAAVLRLADLLDEASGAMAAHGSAVESVPFLPW